jgi:hypothetical protein
LTAYKLNLDKALKIAAVLAKDHAKYSKTPRCL